MRRSLPRSPRTAPPAAQTCLAALLLVLPLTAPRFLPEAGTMTFVPLQAPAAASSLEIEQLTPERLALLSTIRFAEGTWLGGSREGYRVLDGAGRFDGFARHPELEVRSRYVSAAAGADQFLPQTWQAAARDLGLPDFGPAGQDQAALHLVDKRGALSAFDREGLTPEVLARLAPEWASLPTLGGASA